MKIFLKRVSQLYDFNRISVVNDCDHNNHFMPTGKYIVQGHIANVQNPVSLKIFDNLNKANKLIEEISKHNNCYEISES